MFSRPLAKYMWIYKKINIVDIKEMHTIQKWASHLCYFGKTTRIYSVFRCYWPCCKQTSWGWENWCVYWPYRALYELKWLPQICEENNQGNKETKKRGRWAQLKHQPAASKAADFVRTIERSWSCWNPFHVNSGHEESKKNKRLLDC